MKRPAQQGTTTVEFAVVATVLFTVLFGVIDNFRETWGPTEDGDRSGRAMVYFNESDPGRIRFKAGPVWKPGDGK